MAELTFDYNLTLPQEYANTCIGNEPEGQIIQYGINDELQVNEKTVPSLADYSALTWDYFTSLMTIQAVSRIGIKCFPQIGAIGFFRLKYESRSVIIAPIIIDEEYYQAPTLDINQDGVAGTITFTFIPPSNVTYDCYRVVLRNGNFATEYVSYNTSLTINMPKSGTYTISVMGYIDERLASEITYYNDIVITNPNPVPEPAGDYVYSVNDQIGDINGNVEIDATEVPFSDGDFSSDNVGGALSELFGKVHAITVTLTVAGWSGGAQVVAAAGVTASNIVILAPIPSDQANYVAAGIICTAQGTNQLTFTCTEVPTSDIQVGVVIS